MLQRIALSLTLLAASAAGAATHASTFTILYSFCSQSQCADGSGGVGAGNDTEGTGLFGNLLVEDTGLSGGPVIYGTTGEGGANNSGVVFELDPRGDGSYSESVVHNFALPEAFPSSANAASMAFGHPSGFFGTTSIGGNVGNIVKNGGGRPFPNGTGTLFQLAEGDSGYGETTLYDFCALANCVDGAVPLGPLILGAQGRLFGTTLYGGKRTYGTLFRWSPGGGYRVLHSFSRSESPGSGLAKNGQGDLFGTGGDFTIGQDAGGVVYELSAARTYTVLYRFCSIFSNNNCQDGSLPNGPPALDGEGNLYGTTQAGGACNLGTVFRLSPTGDLQILHSFCPDSEGRVRDGATPLTGLVRDKAGNLYGTTLKGGAVSPSLDGLGTVFELVRKAVGTNITYSKRIIWRFSFPATGDTSGCVAGFNNFSCEPANLALDSAGNLYGTMSGGANAAGAVFKLTP